MFGAGASTVYKSHVQSKRSTCIKRVGEKKLLRKARVSWHERGVKTPRAARKPTQLNGGQGRLVGGGVAISQQRPEV
jgi:hypothetical protein